MTPRLRFRNFGDRLHNGGRDVEEMLADVINRTQKAGGNVIIPSFALERAQEILYHLNRLFIQDRIPHLMVFVDSPMAVDVTEVFKHHLDLLDREMQRLIRLNRSPFDFPGLKLVKTIDESKAINHMVPNTLPLQQAVLIEPLACSIHAVDRGDIKPGDVVVVAGAGPLGLGMLAAAQHLLRIGLFL
jgi:Cft2 family RNA processing exonuclease